MNQEETREAARGVALSLLALKSQPNPEDVEQAIDAAVAALGSMEVKLDRNQLKRDIESQVNVYVGPPSVLEDSDEAHDPWLDARREQIKWNFWESYRSWISRSLSPDVVRGLHRMTDQTLDLLEDPSKPGSWDRRGMIVGEVQSGKTSNYTGLITKAADAGYKFIVVLAGMHNSLRSQTQHRLDEGFLGFDSVTTLRPGDSQRSRKKIGIGTGGTRIPPALTLTSSDENGDFHKNRAENVAARIGNDPVLLVVKKNTSVLNNLIQWITSIHGEDDPVLDRRVVADLPLLVIDDEADNASVNTKKVEKKYGSDGELIDETDPTAVNREIRRLLSSFRKSSLVSYTATPFANIFIKESDPDSRHGEDLFPRSFILRMPTPSNHIGPAKVFGIARSDREEAIEPGLPIVRTIKDSEYWLQPKHKKDAKLGTIPESLRQAIRSFLLVIAARRARGQDDVHNSMLVHVTRFIDVQNQIVSQVQHEVDDLSERLSGYGGQEDLGEVLDEFQQLWDHDFRPTSDAMPDTEGHETWDQIRSLLPSVAAKVKVMEINGSGRDSLVYTEGTSVSVIAVGGDKLSRGLTLEGLSVSYYLRASKMYDTLMQMGRWFGFRPGYLDLTRLYTSPDIQAAFRQVSIANEELKEKFDEMSRKGSNPRDFALYVRKSDSLLITAPGKMRDHLKLEIGFAGKIIETIGFSGDVVTQKKNLEIMLQFADSFKEKVDAPGPKRHLMFSDVPGQAIAEIFDGFSTFEGARLARARQLADYIRTQNAKDELREWKVAFITNSAAPNGHHIKILEDDIGLTKRGNVMPVTDQDKLSEIIEGRYAIKRLVDPTHEFLDMTPAQLSTAETLRDRAWFEELENAQARGVDTEKMKKLSLGPFIRGLRSPDRALLLVYLLDLDETGVSGDLEAIPGFAVSFPDSETAESVKYAVPDRYRELINL